MISDKQIEAEIQEKGLTAARVTIDNILAAIADEKYQSVDGTTVTVCVLKLKNGYTVIGHADCVLESNFNKDLGRSIAKKHALDQCWSLFGFHLASVMSGWTMDS